jgi:MFS family permease
MQSGWDSTGSDREIPHPSRFTGQGKLLVPNYLTEFRQNWRAITSGVIGVGGGYGVYSYVGSLFVPHMLKEFGWSKAEFALVGVLSLTAVVSAPAAGRITDVIGARAAAAIGAITVTCCMVAFALMTGDIREFMMLSVVLGFGGIMTSNVVYGRLVATCFTRARGLALAILVSGPPLSGAILALALNQVIAAQGWRAGFFLLAIFIAVFSLIALLLFPRIERTEAQKPARRSMKADYGTFMHLKAFWLIAGGMALINIPQPLQNTQMTLILMESGATSYLAGMMISLYAAGVLVGRFICGFALDRLPPHLVCAAVLCIPAIGLFILASSATSPLLLGLAVLMMGLSQGGEGDIATFMVARHFGMDVFSSVSGLVISAIAIGSTAGSLLLGAVLAQTHSYDAFLIPGGIAVLAGSAMFAMLGRQPVAREPLAAT